MNGLYSTYGCQNDEFNKLNQEMKKTYDQLNNQSSYQHKKMNILYNNLDRVIESDPWLKANCNAYSPVDVIALN